MAQLITNQNLREHSLECVPPPRHSEIGTVPLPARSRCMHISEVGYKYWPLYQYSRRRAQFNVKPSSSRNGKLTISNISRI